MYSLESNTAVNTGGNDSSSSSSFSRAVARRSHETFLHGKNTLPSSKSILPYKQQSTILAYDTQLHNGSSHSENNTTAAEAVEAATLQYCTCSKIAAAAAAGTGGRNQTFNKTMPAQNLDTHLSACTTHTTARTIPGSETPVRWCLESGPLSGKRPPKFRQHRVSVE